MNSELTRTDESTVHRLQSTDGESGPTELGARYHLRGEGVTEVAMVDGQQVVLEPVDTNVDREYILPMNMVPSVDCRRIE